MPRAKRHFFPGYVWHLTQRCHKREFLLEASREKESWLNWLAESKKRYGLVVLDYTVTSNHVHLLALSPGIANAIARTMHLASSRVAQEYNFRVQRRGAFWEDRYHSTAVEAGAHLVRCSAYIDMNMVRAGIVTHPEEWEYGGYAEIHGDPGGRSIIDIGDWLEIMKIKDPGLFRRIHRMAIETALKKHELINRDARWSETKATGSRDFVRSFQRKLGGSLRRNEIIKNGGPYELRERREEYANLNPYSSRILSHRNKRRYPGPTPDQKFSSSSRKMPSLAVAST
jgi:putative transposase